MATLLERYALRNDAVLKKRVNAAVWDKALRVLNKNTSTDQEKQTANTRLKRELDEKEWMHFATYFAAAGGSSASDDVTLQAAIDKAYDTL